MENVVGREASSPSVWEASTQSRVELNQRSQEGKNAVQEKQQRFRTEKKKSSRRILFFCLLLCFLFLICFLLPVWTPNLSGRLFAGLD